MTCDGCGSEDAVVHLTQVEDDETRTLHLCARCAEERGVDTPKVPENFLLAGVLAKLGSGEEGGEGKSPRSGSGGPGPCDFCGLSLRDFKETGRLGCPHCWSTFERQLRPLLNRVQGAAQHVGKVYLPPDPTTTQREKRLDGLRRKLARAVELEDFERAAELRDAIRVLQIPEPVGKGTAGEATGDAGGGSSSPSSAGSKSEATPRPRKSGGRGRTEDPT
jgi:protein arginine kinase activator